MYETFFGLNERPFSLTPDTQFFYNQQSHRSALNTLLVAIRHSEGFVKITGEVGTGKTILCRQLLSLLEGKVVTAYIPNPYLTPSELKAFLAEEIGADFDRDMPAYQLQTVLFDRLMVLAREKKQVVLIIDEAQAMPRETLEALRLLTNLETEKRKLIQVVLFGQPELDELLNRKDLRQLRQRIVFSEHLLPLGRKRVGEYLCHRLSHAGCDRHFFSFAARQLIYLGAAGIPRLVNILAHKAMLCAYGRGDNVINSFHVAKAIADTRESRRLGRVVALRWHLLWPVLGGASAYCLLVLPHWLGG